MNVQFEYLYRDAGNFKNWGEIVFSNPNNIGAETLAALAHEARRINCLYFVASEIGVPDLHFPEQVKEIDHDWHEVHALHFTDNPPNDPQARDIETFIELLQRVSQGT